MEPESALPAAATDVARDGLYLYGVTRSRNWRGSPRGSQDLTRVRFRDLEAIVRPVPYRPVGVDDAGIHDHQRTLDASMRRGVVVPVPFGLVFRGRRAVIRFLEDQYIALDEGLAFLDGHWELRLHIMADDDEDERLRELCNQLYAELRRFARAAIPLRSMPGRLLSAAFLVDRSAWIQFVEQSEDMNRAHPALVFDLTGPWPPYDFVKVQP